MAVYYVELSGGDIQPNASLSGGGISVANTLAGGDIYPGGSGGGGASLVSTSVSYTPTAAGISDTLTPPAGYDGFDQVGVTVSGDADLVAGNIKNGVTIFGVTGNYSGDGASLVSTSVSYTPSTSAISDTLTPPTGYDGFSQVDVAVDAVPLGGNVGISSSIQSNGAVASVIHIGTGGYFASGDYNASTDPGEVTVRTSSDLTASGATVTAPAGYYASNATKTIPNASSPQLSGVGVNNDGSVDVDLDIDNGGYIAATSTTLPAGYLNVRAAQTIHPSTSDQTIPADYYLLGAQTIKGVTYSGLDASNIKKDVVVKIGDSADDDRIVSVTGTYEGGGGGYTPDQVVTREYTDFVAPTATSVKTYLFANCTTLTSFGGPSVTSIASYAFNNCTNLTSVNLPKYVPANYNGAVFYGCSKLGGFVMKNTSNGYFDTNFFRNCSLLAYFDGRGTNFRNSTFEGCSSLTVVVIRNASVCALAGTGVFNSTPFASTGTGGTLYVPSAQISSYQSASNWSTILGYANNQIKSIESTHTDPTAPIDLTLYYADGTAI